jgi:hypothetical protein
MAGDIEKMNSYLSNSILIRLLPKMKAFIFRQLSFSTDLWDVISNLRAQQAVLMERVKKMGGR